MQYSHDSGIRDRVRELVREGWTVKNGGAHSMLYTPSRRYRLAIPGSPGCANTRHAFLQQVKRIMRMEQEHLSKVGA
jgi:hypothetical protein